MALVSCCVAEQWQWKWHERGADLWVSTRLNHHSYGRDCVKFGKKIMDGCRLQKSPCLTSCSPVVNCVKQASITRLQTTLYLTDFYTLTTGSKHGENVICDGLITVCYCYTWWFITIWHTIGYYCNTLYSQLH